MRKTRLVDNHDAATVKANRKAAENMKPRKLVDRVTHDVKPIAPMKVTLPPPVKAIKKTSAAKRRK